MSDTMHPLVTETDIELQKWLKQGREIVHPTMGIQRDHDGNARMRPINTQEMGCILKRIGQLEKSETGEEMDEMPLAEQASLKLGRGQMPGVRSAG